MWIVTASDSDYVPRRKRATPSETRAVYPPGGRSVVADPSLECASTLYPCPREPFERRTLDLARSRGGVGWGRDEPRARARVQPRAAAVSLTRPPAPRLRLVHPRRATHRTQIMPP